MHSLFRLLLVVLHYQFVAIPIANALPDTDREAQRAAAVQFTVNRNDEIAGALRFSTRETHFQARLENPWRVVTEVQLNEHRLDAEIDLLNKMAILDGHGATLSIEQIMDLTAIGVELERLVASQNRDPLPHEDMLYRVLSSYALGFAGYVMNRVEVEATFGTCQPIPATTPNPVCGAPASNTEPEYFLSCNPFLPLCVLDPIIMDTGICYLRGTGPNDGCECGYYLVSHDEFNLVTPYPFDHCYCDELLGAGCSIDGDCRGRGGAKCSGNVTILACAFMNNTNGKGIYTHDFAAHDRCCDVHEPLFCAGVWCENEALASLDDCLFGQPNCVDGCCSQDDDCPICEYCEVRSPHQPNRCVPVDCPTCNECDGLHGCTSYDCCGDVDCDQGNPCSPGLCVDHVCQYASTECNDDSECDTGNACDRCVNGCCETLSTCFMGLFCGGGDPCTAHLCVGGCCESQPECITNLDCRD